MTEKKLKLSLHTDNLIFLQYKHLAWIESFRSVILLNIIKYYSSRSKDILKRSKGESKD